MTRDVTILESREVAGCRVSTRPGSARPGCADTSGSEVSWPRAVGRHASSNRERWSAAAGTACTSSASGKSRPGR